MAFLLDTNVVSEARKNTKADANLAAWLKVQNPVHLFVSAVTITEIEIGILLLERRDIAQGRHFRQWLEESVLPTFEHRIFPVSLDVARRCAAFHVPDRRPDRDAMIAATAVVHGLVVATRNVKDFTPMGVPVVNPWSPELSTGS